jgi:hypothetical protein
MGRAVRGLAHHSPASLFCSPRRDEVASRASVLHRGATTMAAPRRPRHVLRRRDVSEAAGAEEEQQDYSVQRQCHFVFFTDHDTALESNPCVLGIPRRRPPYRTWASSPTPRKPRCRSIPRPAPALLIPVQQVILHFKLFLLSA